MAEYLPFFLIALGGGFLSATFGGSGLFMTPGFMICGLPPQTAVAVSQFSGLGASSVSLFKFHHGGKIVWRLVLPLSVLAAIASFFSVQIVLHIPPDAIRAVLAFFTLFLLPLVFFKKKLGIESVARTRAMHFAGYSVFFLLMLLSSFSIGAVTFIALVFFFGLTLIEANATSAIPWLIVYLIATVLFFGAGVLSMTHGLVALAGMAVGGYAGAHIALRNGDRWIKAGFLIVTTLMALKLFYEAVV